MQFPESWLRSFVNPPLTTDELAHRLTMAGLEVEAVKPAAPPCSKIVVGKVIEVRKHPDADRLSICQVDAGTGELLQIVCGAPNVRAGILTPCALAGAELPPGADGAPTRIQAGLLRGVESGGMLCSARELGLPEDRGGLMILPDDAPVGADIRRVLDLDDPVFLIKLTPNRADCLSIHGVAREVAALTDTPIALPSSAPVAVTLADRLPVEVAAPDLCGRFSGRVIRGVDAHAKTPAWMARRIERAGMRCVSALVDISNYVMLESGSPSHVFDLDRIRGGLTVRWGRPGESLTLLNGERIDVDAAVGVIADHAAIESLAGIMGGARTAVTLDTRNIYLEVAFWWPAAIQGRARRYHFATDAGHRFERGVDYASTVARLERISALILEICGGQAGPVDDQIIELPERAPVRMRRARAARVLGMPITHEMAAGVFDRLGFAYSMAGDDFIVMPPSYRFDLEIEEDLIEEVARIHGFERIPAKPPVAEQTMRPTCEARRTLHDVRHAIAARDYHELVNFAFVEAEWEADFSEAQPIALRNPIASQYAVMRSTLIGGLLDRLRYNLNRKATRVRLFEVGRVFRRDARIAEDGWSVPGYAQPVLAGGIACGDAKDEQWGMPARAVDFFDVKGDVESLLWPLRARFESAGHPALHPGRAARVMVEGRPIGWIGELHPRWLQKYELPGAPIVWELELDAMTAVGLPIYREVPRVPAVTRDIALVVRHDVAAQDMIDVLVRAAEGRPWQRCLQRVALFDEFRPKAAAAGLGAREKSLAFRITLQDTDSTLQDDLVEAALQQLIHAAGEAFGARLRA